MVKKITLLSKTLAFGIIILITGILVIPETIANYDDTDDNVNDDVEIIISAGFYDLDIGTCLKIDVINNKDENITVFYSISSNYLFTNLRDGTNRWTSTYDGIGNYTSLYFKYFLGFGIDLFSITVECENNSVTRNGIWIGVRFCILFK